MFGTHDLALFAATVFVLNATPGVDLMLTLATTLRHGVKGGLAVASGICAGCSVHTLAAAFGLAAVLAASAAVFSAVKWAGAAYLLWLGIGLWRDARRSWRAGAAHGSAGPGVTAGVGADGDSRGAVGTSAWTLFRQGLFTNVLNPKVALFFLALLPQFIDAAAPGKVAAFLFLGAWFVVQGWLFLAGFVLLVAPLARWQPRAVVKAVLQAVGGTLFGVLALRLATSRT